MIYEFLTDGFEELEAIAPIDLLRRAGIDVRTVGVWLKPGSGKTVTGSHGVPVACDITLDEVDPEAMEGILLPGGPGHTRLAESGDLLELISVAARRGKLLAAICAAPSVLGQNGYLKGQRACCYPGFEEDLCDALIVDDPVVRHGNIITSRGAGTSVPFALSIISYLVSPAMADKIAGQIQCP